MRWARSLAAVACACTVALTAVTAATALAANSLPRLTYVAKLNGGASVRLTLARGHKSIDSYEILHASGHQTRNGKTIPHGTCGFEGRGAKGVFKPVAVTKGKFSYRLGAAFRLTGTIKRGEITGTFTFSDPAAGKTPACSTGTVRFTAKA
jgi:hypothetical protein